MMIKPKLLKTIFLLFTLSWPSFVEPHVIFTYLSQKSTENHKLISKLLKKDMSWRGVTNDEGYTPLIVAIINRDIKAVKILLSHGADVNERNHPPLNNKENEYQRKYPLEFALDLKYAPIGLQLLRNPLIKMQGKNLPKGYLLALAMNKFFNFRTFLEDLENSKQKKFTCNDECKMAKKFLKAAIRERSEQLSIEQILEVVDLFSSRLAVARAIRKISLIKGFKRDEVVEILSRYQLLFLQDYILSANQLKNVVLELYPVGEDRHILGLILENYLQKRGRDKLVKTLKTSRHISHRSLLLVDYNSDEVALSILARDKELFMKLPPKQVIKQHIRGQQPGSLSDALDAVNHLNKFVQFSILWPQKGRQRNLVYDFWLNVVRRLKKEGDIFSAFAIAAALENSYITKALKLGPNKELQFVNTEKRYANYRLLEEEFADKFFLPSLEVTLHDIRMLLDSSSILQKPVLTAEEDANHIKSFVQKRKDLNLSYINSLSAGRGRDAGLKRVIENLPDIEENLIYALYRLAIYHPDQESSVKPDFKNILEWQVQDIENWVNYSPIPREDKRKFFEQLIYEFKTISGKDLLAQLPVWSKNIISSLATTGVKTLKSWRLKNYYFNLLMSDIEKNTYEHYLMNEEAGAEFVARKTAAIGELEQTYRVILPKKVTERRRRASGVDHEESSLGNSAHSEEEKCDEESFGLTMTTSNEM